MLSVYAMHLQADRPPADLRERLRSYGARECVVQVACHGGRWVRRAWYLVRGRQVTRLASGRLLCCVCGLPKTWPVDVVCGRDRHGHTTYICRVCGTEAPPVYELSPGRELLLRRAAAVPADMGSDCPECSYFNVG